jgi:ATP-dependent DNA helicase RecQ
VIERGYDKIKTWGVGRELKGDEWADYIFQLLNLGYVDIAYDEGYTFKLNDLSHLVLKNKTQVMLVKYRPYQEREKVTLPKKETLEKAELNQTLFDRLKQLRKTIADQNNIPAYIVFSDKTLQDMTQKLPTDKITMLEVNGVAQRKFATYGQKFLDEISSFKRNEAIKE